MPGHQILIIEDNPDIAGLLTLDLQDEGYAVHHEATAITGLTAARATTPEVILLDLGLPDLDGRHVLIRLRKFSAVPVIVLTARGSVEEKVELLTLGADDYLVKPYALAELLARIQVQLRHHRDTVIQLGALELNPLARQALYQGRDLRLTSKEFEILSALADTAGRVIRREELLARVWKHELPEHSNAIDVHIANLRKKLQEAGATGLLRTVRGYGYSLQPQAHNGIKGPVN
ncbi:response regulator transcription factor [Deinococcus multiflagellatus]|uniref:Response regulator transcription factor n=1 Tax=Deinococcus multiflagellatus TaxID=1656887 RepID=A0ABW1ZS47_9DEIO|nr:response regulator transcription factor [Deinococcus multiflagellatus]MBZ9714519.1 response regulator transcription factor [Deinococcus multiflagellatus]